MRQDGKFETLQRASSRFSPRSNERVSTPQPTVRPQSSDKPQTPSKHTERNLSSQHWVKSQQGTPGNFIPRSDDRFGTPQSKRPDLAAHPQTPSTRGGARILSRPKTPKARVSLTPQTQTPSHSRALTPQRQITPQVNIFYACLMCRYFIRGAWQPPARKRTPLKRDRSLISPAKSLSSTSLSLRTSSSSSVRPFASRVRTAPALSTAAKRRREVRDSAQPIPEAVAATPGSNEKVCARNLFQTLFLLQVNLRFVDQFPSWPPRSIK